MYSSKSPRSARAILAAAAAAAGIIMAAATAARADIYLNAYVSNWGNTSIDVVPYDVTNSTWGAATTLVTSSEIDEPLGLVLGYGGNLFAANYGNSTIAEISNLGGSPSVSVFTSSPDGLTGLTDLAYDPINQNLYVSGTTGLGNGTGGIVEITPTGSVTVLEQAGSTSGGLYKPKGVAVGAVGNTNVYAVNSDGGISQIPAAGGPATEVVSAGGLGTGADGPAFDAGGNLFVATYTAAGTVYEVTGLTSNGGAGSGTVSTAFSTGYNSDNLAFGPNGDLLVAYTASGTSSSYTDTLGEWGLGPSGWSQVGTVGSGFNGPSAVGVPEPATLSLLALGGLGLLLARRRRRRTEGHDGLVTQ